MNLYWSVYENLIIMGHFNIEVGNISAKNLTGNFNLINLIGEPTGFKNPSCLDLTLTNRPRSLCYCDRSVSFSFDDTHCNESFFRKYKSTNKISTLQIFENNAFRVDLLSEILIIWNLKFQYCNKHQRFYLVPWCLQQTFELSCTLQAEMWASQSITIYE